MSDDTLEKGLMGHIRIMMPRSASITGVQAYTLHYWGSGDYVQILEDST